MDCFIRSEQRKSSCGKSATGRWQAVCLWEVDSEWRFQCFFLFFGIPGLLGQEYLREYGGTKEFSVFRPEILIAAVGFTLLIIEAAIQKI